MITEIKIRRFKALVVADLCLDAVGLAVLVGDNSSGKSSILEAVQAAIAGAQLVASANPHRDWGSDVCHAAVSGDRLGAMRVDPRRAVSHDAESFEVSFSTETQTCKVVVRPAADLVRIEVHGAALGEQLMAAARPFGVYAPGLSGIPVREVPQADGVVRAAAGRGDSNLVLRNVMALLRQQATKFSDFEEELREFFPEASIEIGAGGADGHDLDVRCSFAGRGRVSLENAGNGFLQCVQILAYRHLFAPRLLLLDEPDAHLHPLNQRRLCELLRAVSERESMQVLLATHSRHVASALRGRARFHWIRRGAVVEMANSDLVSALQELGALDDGEQFAGKLVKALVLTEDTNPDLLKPVLESSGFEMQETVVVPYHGCTNETAARVVIEMFQDRLPGVRVLVHRDRDQLTAPRVAELREKYSKLGATLFVTRGNDLEAEYLSVPYLTSLGIDPGDAEALLLTAMNSRQDQSVRKMIGNRVREEYLRIDRTQGSRTAPDYGDVALRAIKDYAADPVANRHGKKVLAELRDLLQKRGVRFEHRRDGSLKDPTLFAAAAEIWPDETPGAPASPPAPENTEPAGSDR